MPFEDAWMPSKAVQTPGPSGRGGYSIPDNMVLVQRPESLFNSNSNLSLTCSAVLYDFKLWTTQGSPSYLPVRVPNLSACESRSRGNTGAGSRTGGLVRCLDGQIANVVMQSYRRRVVVE